MKDLTFRAPPSLAIAVGATSPSGGVNGAVAWSTTTNSLMFWNGTSWFPYAVAPFPTPVSKSAAYTFVLADANVPYLHPSADTTARTFTIPANSSVAYPVGTVIPIFNEHGAGIITIAITTDTMYLALADVTGSRTLAASGWFIAMKLASTEWLCWGVGVT